MEPAPADALARYGDALHECPGKLERGPRDWRVGTLRLTASAFVVEQDDGAVAATIGDVVRVVAVDKPSGIKTWNFRGRRVAATPRPGTWVYSAETGRGGAVPWRRVAAAPRPGTWMFRGDGSRRRRGYDACPSVLATAFKATSPS